MWKGKRVKPKFYSYGESRGKQDSQLYVWIRSNGNVSIVNDPVEIYHSPDFDKSGDQIHLLGEEVEVKFSVEKKDKKVYRGGTE